MKELGTIKAIYRYPVKSMGGESLAEVSLSAQGIVGDRAWAVRDEVRGGIRGAKKIPTLMQCAARYESEPTSGAAPPARITLPTGETLWSNDEDAGTRVSAAVDHAVTLWPLLPADALDHYRRGAPDDEDLEAELRSIFGRNADEPLPDLTKFPPEIFEYESPLGTYFDAYPLMLMTQTSLDHMQATFPESIFDVRRFRPNFLIEAKDPEGTLPELGWGASRIQIGDTTINTTIDCPRCVMTTHGFADLPRDPRIMRAIVKEGGGSLGVYAAVDTPGRVRVGDTVQLT